MYVKSKAKIADCPNVVAFVERYEFTPVLFLNCVMVGSPSGLMPCHQW